MAMPKKDRTPKETVWDPGEANPKQALFYQARTMFIAYGGAKGGGKALKNGTPVCTPDGWIPIEKLKPGDLATGSDGKPCEVLGVYPQGEKPLYDVRFRDGFSITVSGEHLWKCRITGKPHKVKGKRFTRDNWEVLTTEQIIGKMGRLRSNQSVVIPLCRPVDWPKRELPAPPYTIGALIGDGALSGTNVSFSSADDEVLDRIRADGYTLHKRKAGCDYGVLGIRPVIVALGLNGTSYEKRVPEMYLNGCIEDRLELLRGLMDTDGFCDKRGHCSYCSVNEGLAKDVQYLVRSLGGIATVSRKERKSGLSFEVSIRMPDDLNDIFYLTRKRERLRPYNGGVSDVTRRIVSVTPAGSGECTCIRVDSEDHLFVADGFTVTHNTHAVRTKAFGGALFNPGIRILVMRLTYPSLEENHIIPMRRMATQTGAATYNGTTHMLSFVNGSTIRFGHWSGEDSEDEYQGQEYDWVFVDEATQFSERAFNYLGGLLRGSTPFPKRMYLTCNPGGKT